MKFMVKKDDKTYWLQKKKFENQLQKELVIGSLSLATSYYFRLYFNLLGMRKHHSLLTQEQYNSANILIVLWSLS